MKLWIKIAALITLSSFDGAPLHAQWVGKSVKQETLSLFDVARHRSVPVAIDTDATQQIRGPKLAIHQPRLRREEH